MPWRGPTSFTQGRTWGFNTSAGFPQQVWGQDPLEQVWRVTGGGVADPLQQVQRMSSFSVKVGAVLGVTRRIRDPSHLQEGLVIGGT